MAASSYTCACLIHKALSYPLLLVQGIPFAHIFPVHLLLSFHSRCIISFYNFIASNAFLNPIFTSSTTARFHGEEASSGIASNSSFSRQSQTTCKHHALCNTTNILTHHSSTSQAQSICQPPSRNARTEATGNFCSPSSSLMPRSIY